MVPKVFQITNSTKDGQVEIKKIYWKNIQTIVGLSRC
jgi:hypothetical protein